jgi:hypothetical protein
MQNFDRNIGFWEKRHFFRRKLSKISENCDHNIDPWSPWLLNREMAPKTDWWYPVQMIIYKACRVDFDFNETVCDNLVTDFKDENELVQNEVQSRKNVKSTQSM